jgi:hypothetical protein
MQRLNADFALRPLSKDEHTTLGVMLEQEEDSNVLLMPTHHVSADGEVNGFRYSVPCNKSSACLPVNRRMFFGHTCVECAASEADIVRIISNQEENKAKMRDFIAHLRQNERPANLFKAIPDNASIINEQGILRSTDLKSVDCDSWYPEVPETIGIYHAYVKAFNRSQRSHKLFLVVSGGMWAACDNFYNMMVDVGRHFSSQDMVNSEETWWLRRACLRSRCRLLKMLADWFGLRVPYVDDVQAYDSSVHLAVHTTDTLENDVSCVGGRVHFNNSCVDTTKIANGMLVRMHPSEGYVLFRGNSRGSSEYGAMFGFHSVCGAFPTRSPVVSKGSANSVRVRPSPEIVVQDASAAEENYMCFDEALFKILEKMQWNRDNGFIELIPIIVGV